jgi:hypothetical protein
MNNFISKFVCVCVCVRCVWAWVRACVYSLNKIQTCKNQLWCFQSFFFMFDIIYMFVFPSHHLILSVWIKKEESDQKSQVTSTLASLSQGHSFQYQLRNHPFTDISWLSSAPRCKYHNHFLTHHFRFTSHNDLTTQHHITYTVKKKLPKNQY